MLDIIYAENFFAYLHGFSAVDFWLAEKQTNNFIYILTNADTAALAKLFENLRYPGVDLADAALDDDDKTYYFRCADSVNANKTSFDLLDFYYNCKTKTFIDPHEIYPVLKEIRQNLINDLNNQKNNENQISPLLILNDCFNPDIDRTLSLMDAALILSKYFSHDCVSEKDIKKIATLFKNSDTSQTQNRTQIVRTPSAEEQRVFLCELITSPNPGLGFELLKNCGFLDMFWSELASLDQADHSKEFHPEGNGWEHTMETFRHRKTGTNKTFLQAVYSYDLRLSLGLLLHDSGKPLAPAAGNKRYDGHAELGEMQARRFLERLGFGSALITDVCFLVRNHMLPAALPRLPLFRTEQIMSSSLFPLLMELYRCDESSSFKGLDGYYESSAVYQQFLKNRRNPYRSVNGKKLNKKQKNKK